LTGAVLALALARVDVADLAAWIASIDFALWPQQHRVDERLRPAMVKDLGWQGFGERTDALVRHLGHAVLHLYKCQGGDADNRMLSVVMPGHSIPPHVDEQQPNWLTRVHVPLQTNPKAVMVLAGEEQHLEVGAAYLIDTRVEHAIRNDGPTPRIHFMFDVRRSA
jgi:hypothetical protein